MQKKLFKITLSCLMVLTVLTFNTKTYGQEKSSFSDINENTEHYQNILWCIENGVSTGFVSNGVVSFKPYENMTRADMAALLYRVANKLNLVDTSKTYSQTFSDVKLSDWTKSNGQALDHYKGIAWMASVGITTGFDVNNEKLYKPYDNIKRADLAAFLYRFAKLVNEANINNEEILKLSNNFNDVNASEFKNASGEYLDHYYGMIWMANNQISKGWSSNGLTLFKPYDNVKRGDMAAFLNRTDTYIVEVKQEAEETKEAVEETNQEVETPIEQETTTENESKEETAPTEVVEEDKEVEETTETTTEEVKEDTTEQETPAEQETEKVEESKEEVEEAKEVVVDTSETTEVEETNQEIVFNNISTLLIYNPLITLSSENNKSTGDIGNTIGKPTNNESINIRNNNTGKLYDYKAVEQFNANDNINEISGSVNIDTTTQNSVSENDVISNSEVIITYENNTKSFYLNNAFSAGKSVTFNKIVETHYAIVWLENDDQYLYNNGQLLLDNSRIEELRDYLDNNVVSKIHDNFGIGRFIDIENGKKLNILIHYSPGNTGYFTYVDIWHSEEEPGFNVATAIIHLNSQKLYEYIITPNKDVKEFYSTITHEYQHLVAQSDVYDHNKYNWSYELYNDEWVYLAKNPNNEIVGVLNLFPKWINESMSARANEISYPGDRVNRNHIYFYNYSKNMAKGQSLYVSFSSSEKETIKTPLEVTYNTNKHLYGKVALFSQYLINTFNDKVFLKIHDYWRNNTNQTVVDALYYSVNQFNTNSETISKIENSIKYKDSLIDESSNKLNTIEKQFLSKTVLDYYIQEIQNNIKSDDWVQYSKIQSQPNPLLFTQDFANIEAGGRIIVVPKNNIYVVPVDSDQELVYVGFNEDGEIVMPARHATKSFDAKQVSLKTPSCLSINKEIYNFYSNLNTDQNIITCNGINIISKNIDLTERKYKFILSN